MSLTQSSKETIPYSNLTTFVFLGIVVMLPLFLFFQPRLIFEAYGAFPLILGLWTFLKAPLVKIKQRNMKSLFDRAPELAEQIANMPAYLKLRNRPVLLYVPSSTSEIFAFGSWRGQYIAISEGAISKSTDTRNLTGVITHEIAHIANGDTWKTALSTHFVFWLVGISLYFSVRNFPYSMFFTMYNEYRNSWGFSDIVTPLTFLVPELTIVLALRFMYRMKEFGADDFAREHMGLVQFAKAFAVPSTKQALVHKERSAPRQAFQEKLMDLLRFHPTPQARLMALQSSTYILGELQSLIFILGLAIGFVSCFSLDLDSSFDTMLAGEIAIGFLALQLFIPLHISNTYTGQIRILARYVINLANGIALMFCALVGINNLLVELSGSEQLAMYWREGSDLKVNLFVTLDVLLLILVVAPIIILALLSISWFFIRAISPIASSWQARLLSLLGLFPIVVWLSDLTIHWWAGTPISLINLLFRASYCVLWFLFVTLLWWLYSKYQHQRTSDHNGTT